MSPITKILLSVGDQAPNFKLKSSDNREVSLTDFLGKKVILYFYPKDMTPGCTKEACSFRDNYSEIKNRGAEVIGISTDAVTLHQKFIEKHQLPFILLSDTEKEVVKLYGVWKKKSLYGKLFYGISRSTFIIDEKGKIQSIFTDVKVNGHTEEVLKNI